MFSKPLSWFMLISFVCQLIVEIDLLRLICNWKLQEVEGVEELALCNLVCFWAAFWNFYNSFVQGGYFHLKYSFIEIYIQRSKANHLFLIFCACLIYILFESDEINHILPHRLDKRLLFCSFLILKFVHIENETLAKWNLK